MNGQTNKAAGVSAAVDVLKYTLTLATGSLVFSASLLKEDVVITCVGKYLLGVSWCCLGCSIVAGALAFSRVPVMIAEGNADINDKWFKWPGRIHHIAFLVGVLVLGSAMTLILFNK